MLMFKVLQLFQIADDVDEVERYGRGFINRTYFAKGKSNDYILQMMDCSLCGKPEKSIDNTTLICKHLASKHTDSNQFVDLYTSDGERFIKLQNTIWHGFSMPKNKKLFKRIINVNMMEEIGKSLGFFHRSMLDFPVEKLYCINHELHDFQNQYERMMIASSTDPHQRSLMAFNETKFINDRHETFFTIDKLIEQKKIPLRIAHNNIRLNNILFKEENYQYSAIIGYDLVGIGTILYDLGETIRHLASTAREDDLYFEAIKIELDYFRAFIKGYFKEMNSFLTIAEEENIVEAARIMVLEEAMRYVTDFLENDITYKPQYHHQNLDRAKNQIQLVKDIEKNYVIMNDIVRSAKQEALEKK